MATAVIMPKQGNTVEECTILQWAKKPGDRVAKGEVLCSIETDKATFDVEAPEDGVLLATFFGADEIVPVLENIAAIGNEGEDAESFRPKKEARPPSAGGGAAARGTPVVQAGPTPVQTAGTVGVGISPRARNTAARLGVDARALPGSGPGGLVIERDVSAAASAVGRLTWAARELAGRGFVASGVGTGIGGSVRAGDMAPGGQPAATLASPRPEIDGAKKTAPVKGLRKIIAERMWQSAQTTAAFTLHMKADARALEAARKTVKAETRKGGCPNISLNDMVMHTVVRALKKCPWMNAHFFGDEIVEYENVNLGFAVDTERGLMVPVLKAAHEKTVSEIALEVRRLAADCKKGGISPDFLKGGTFTVSNLGSMGVEFFSPVINVPEVAILGICNITPEVAVENGEYVFIPKMGFSLTVDHRAVDGAPGARFLLELCNMIAEYKLEI